MFLYSKILQYKSLLLPSEKNNKGKSRIDVTDIHVSPVNTADTVTSKLTENNFVFVLFAHIYWHQ